jgi:hypothetical protein
MSSRVSHHRANLYLVGWRDACDPKEPWLELSDMTPSKLGHNVCYSVGWLIGEVNDYVVLASTAGTEEPHLNEIVDLGNVKSIPVNWVLFMEKIPYELPKKYSKQLRVKVGR